MAAIIDVPIPLDVDVAEALRDPVRREAVGRYVSLIPKDHRLHDTLRGALNDLKAEARQNGLTDAVVDAELIACRTQRARD